MLVNRYNNNQANIFYIDSTFHLNKIQNIAKFNSFQLVLVGRLLNAFTLFSRVFDNIIVENKVLFRYESGFGKFDYILDDKNISFDVNFSLNTSYNLKNNEDLDISSFVKNNSEKVSISFYKQTNDLLEKFSIRGFTEFTLNNGDVASDFNDMLNMLGYKYCAFSLGVSVDNILNGYNVNESGGFVCILKNDFTDEKLAQNLRFDLNKCDDIKTLQKRYSHNGFKLISDVFPSQYFKLNDTKIFSIYKDHNLRTNVKFIDTVSKRNDLSIVGIFENNSEQYGILYNINFEGSSLANTDNEFVKQCKIVEKLYNKKFRIYSNSFDLLSGSSHGLGLCWKLSNNFSNEIIATGEMDVYGYVHYVDNIIGKILTCENAKKDMILIPYENKYLVDKYLKNNKKFNIKIRYINHIGELSYVR